MGSLVKRGDKWTAQARLPDSFKGAAKARSINATFKKKADAQLWLDSTESAMKLGTWVDPRLQTKDVGSHAWTDKKLSQALDAYRESVTPEKKGASQESSMLLMLARSDIGSERIRDLTVEKFLKFRDSRLKEGKAKNTVKNNLNTFSAVYEWLIHEQEVPSLKNPIKTLRARKRMPQPDNARERRLRDGEEQTLIDNCDAYQTPYGRQWRILLPLLLETGMRLGEAISIRVEWLKIERGFIVIPTSKNREPRYVALPYDVFDSLASLSEGESDDRTVFRMDEQAAKNAWRHHIRGEIKNLKLHDLRHEALSRMAARGADLKTLMRQSGHKTVAVLMRYLNPTPQEQRERLYGTVPVPAPISDESEMV